MEREHRASKITDRNRVGRLVSAVFYRAELFDLTPHAGRFSVGSARSVLGMPPAAVAFTYAIVRHGLPRYSSPNQQFKRLPTVQSPSMRPSLICCSVALLCSWWE